MPLLSELRALARELIPDTCPRCRMSSAGGFCGDCRRDFVRVGSPCPRCGLPAPCRRCPALAAGWLLDAVRAPYLYAAPLAGCLQALKYAKERRFGAALGRLLALEVDSARSGCDIVVAVPLHPARLRQRSFNQADEIARPLARALGARLLAAGIRRTRHTEPQTALDRGERLRSLDGAFAVRGSLAGLSIAIVDDVITTGATINALAAALRSAGAVGVEAFAVARAVGGADADDAQAARNR